jgi:hypothetical protein
LPAEVIVAVATSRQRADALAAQAAAARHQSIGPTVYDAVYVGPLAADTLEPGTTCRGPLPVSPMIMNSCMTAKVRRRARLTGAAFHPAAGLQQRPPRKATARAAE